MPPTTIPTVAAVNGAPEGIRTPNLLVSGCDLSEVRLSGHLSLLTILSRQRRRGMITARTQRPHRCVTVHKIRAVCLKSGSTVVAL